MTNPDDTVTSPAPWRAGNSGLTKRELFAGLAMMNLQNVLLRKSGGSMLKELCVQSGTANFEKVIAKYAVAQADALIEALNYGKTESHGGL